jgi:hypothetical protein
MNESASPPRESASPRAQGAIVIGAHAAPLYTAPLHTTPLHTAPPHMPLLVMEATR